MYCGPNCALGYDVHHKSKGRNGTRGVVGHRAGTVERQDGPILGGLARAFGGVFGGEFAGAAATPMLSVIAVEL